MENELKDRDNITGRSNKQPIQAAIVPPRTVTYKFMKELDQACDRFLSKRGIKYKW